METLSREAVAARILLIDDEEERAAAAELALELYGEAPQTERFSSFIFDAAGYIRRFLGWDPWIGQGRSAPGQIEIIEAYNLALRQQFEKFDYEAGRVRKRDLVYYSPDKVIQNYIRMQSGNNSGKTKLATGLISHFFDCLTPCSIRMYAPTGDALKDNLWEELKTDRVRTSLPGRVFETVEIRMGPNHSIKGRALSNSRGTGAEKIQGKHPMFGMYVVDEAEGIEDFLFDSIDSMTSGGKAAIVLMQANPRTRTSKFHRIKDRANVDSFEMSSLNHPNVVAGREIVPNAVQREYVRSMIETHCEVAAEANVDLETFELDWDVATRDRVLPRGTIFQPDNEFCWRVLGVAPADVSEDTVITPGRYKAAVIRQHVVTLPDEADRVTFGIDVARFGTDFGTLYIRFRNEVWREKQFFKQDSKEYFHAVKDAAMKMAGRGAKRIQIRVDAGGDSSGLIDTLRHNVELRETFVFFQVIPVQFGSSAKDGDKYDDLATQMYFEAKETLLGIKLVNPPETLESDLTLRKWEPVNRSARELKKLQDKKLFRKVIKRSPDDGDGFVLCVAPDHILRAINIPLPAGIAKTSVWGR